MFWTDEITNSIIAKENKDSYLINDSTTPSGQAHVGSLRGLIIHDLIREGLLENGKSAKFVFGFDDFDPMDGLPTYVDQSFEKYMGLPLSAVPAPDGIHTSFADQYASELKEIISYIKIEPEYYYTTELYKAGKFNDSIKLTLDNADKIRAIYKEVSGSDKGDDWYALNVVCPNCGKIGTTRVTGWDGQEVEFECMENMVDWAKGCGYKGKISPFDGNAKLPYKVEWPSKWNFMGIDVEGAGKDHAAAGGTREVSSRIYREVFGKTPPHDAPYEHILIGGAKMSSSKGLGVTAKQMADLLPANILKFLFTRTKYKRAIEFNPEGDTIPLLYDEYDRCAKDFQDKADTDMARAFFYTEKGLFDKLPTYYLRFSKIANFLQMPRMDILAYAKEENGKELTEVEKEEIENRIKVAKLWLSGYAPESVKFAVSDSIPETAKSLSDAQKTYLAKIADAISTQEKWTGEDLHAKIHEIKNEMQIEPKQAFSAIYLSFLGKDSGPQAGWLLASLDQKFVINRLKEV
jgi:lysyl-tRNA synthetase class 1